jgi:AhpD family alkylhydroperoxidase
MEPRIHFEKYAPEALRAMYALERHVSASSLGERLLHLIKVRASQINGCAYCIDMHYKDARAVDETEQRLYELNAWRETSFYSNRERAALEWTEAVTEVAQTHVPDELYESVRKEFSEAELVDLTYAIMAINSWNRLLISFRAVPGTYQPGQKKASVAT